MRVAAVARIGLGTENALSLVMQRVIQPRHHPNGIAEGGVRRDILDSFTINPNLPIVAEAIYEFPRRERAVPVSWLPRSPWLFGCFPLLAIRPILSG